MASTFAPSDIAALLANFPPTPPTKDRPSLLLSNVENSVFNSQKVLSNFRRLVENRHAGDTIKLRDLPAMLHVKDTEWLFNCYGEPIRFTQDKQSIITLPRFGDIMRNLQQASDDFVQLSLFANRYNVSLESITDQDLHEHRVYRIPDSSFPGSSFVANTKVADEMKHKIQLLMVDAGSEEVDLNKHFPTIPLIPLCSFIAEIKAHQDDVQGEFEDRGDRIVYVPYAVTFAQREKQQAAYDSEVQNWLQELEANGYVLFSPKNGQDLNQLQRDVCSRYQMGNEAKEADLCVLDIVDGTRAIVLQNRLDKALEEIEATVEQFIRKTGCENIQTITEKLDSELGKNLKLQSLARLLCRSQHRSILDATIKLKIAEMAREKQRRFDQLFREAVMAPLHLYAAANFGDLTLKQNQDTFLSSFFRLQVIPGFIETVRQEGLLSTSPEDNRFRDVDELKDFCNDASTSQTRIKTFKDLQAAVTSFARRQKIAIPDVEQISQVKRETLRQKGKAIRKMHRGSDVLQNLLWITLAQAVDEGLFVSSGKDTSRMIEQYRLCGNVEIWKKLVAWRDRIKVGKAGAGDIQEMKDLAIETLDTMDVSIAVETEIVNAS